MNILIMYIISLIIIDSNTKEPLTGVQIKNLKNNKSYYTDLDGKVEICDDDSCGYQITHISYSDTIISNIKSDLIIELN